MVALCGIITVVLLLAHYSNISVDESQNNLYITSYISGSYINDATNGNIALVNPTKNTYTNLTIAIQVDQSEIVNPTIRLWAPNYTVNAPNSFLQSVNLYQDMLKQSTSVSSIKIEPNQKLNLSLTFPSSDTFRYSPHNLTIYLSQNSFGDIINGQSLKIPQTEAFIQIVDYSSVQTDNDTYHIYFSSTRPGYVYRCDNPNFLQRYFNISQEIGVANYALAANMGVLGVRYFNVTVHNNTTFSLNSITIFGQLSNRSLLEDWKALPSIVLQPNEILLFPANSRELPTYAYATGYIVT